MIELVNTEETINTRQKYNREKLVECIQQWTKAHDGIPPTAEDFRNNPKYPSTTTYRNMFGNWNNALIAAGLRTNNSPYSRDELITILRQWAKEYERIPTSRDFMHNPKYPGYVTFVNLFGSWTNTLISAGFEPKDKPTKGRQGEIQTISEFKTNGAIDLSGENRNSICDGICPKGEKFDTKSSSLFKIKGFWGWHFGVSINQLKEADYLFLRAYKDEDFTKTPVHKWRIPIEFAEGKTWVTIYKDGYRGVHNVENMKEYEIT